MQRLKKIGLKIVDDVLNGDFNVIVMDYFRRRVKLLAAINRKAKIVSTEWIYECL